MRIEPADAELNARTVFGDRAFILTLTSVQPRGGGIAKSAGARRSSGGTLISARMRSKGGATRAHRSGLDAWTIATIVLPWNHPFLAS